MLHLNTIDNNTHKTLLSLLSKKYLANFSLVGGTALSLQYGHRKSIDLDLFSPEKFEPGILEELIKIDYSDYVYRGNNTYMLFFDIGSVKTDLVYHPFGLLSTIETTDNIRMFGIEDIAAIKCFAVCKRGTRKDFYDIWALTQHFTPNEIAIFFTKKYGDENLIFFKKSVLYFEEANGTDQPEVLIKNLSWETVKKSVFNSFINL